MATLGEGRVAKVFDDDCANATALVGPCIGKGVVDDGLQVPTPFGRAGEWFQVNNANDKFTVVTK